MSIKYGKQFVLLAAALSLLLLATSGHAAKTLSGDEVKALITDKTVSVKRVKDGAQWKAYFGADGTSVTSGAVSGESTWHVDGDGRHCNEGVKLKCAAVVDNGDRTYARVKPNGSPAVMWTEIVDGKNL